MASDDQIQRYEAIKFDLRRAQAALPDSAVDDPAILSFEEYISHNELELACDMLETFAEEYRHQERYERILPAQFWQGLLDAAIKMGLTDRINFFEAGVATADDGNYQNSD